MVAAAVSPCQKQQLLHQLFHILRFLLNRVDGLFQYFLVLFAPPVQHIRISLNHRDWRAQFMGSVGDKPDLLLI